MSAILIGSEIVHYEVLGRGRPLIFLHGWVGSWRYWIPVMQATSISYRAYALDLWGFGDTAKKEALYQPEEQVKLIDAFLNQLGIGRIALIGHGLGAMVALMYAAHFPDAVDRVMAISHPIDGSMINNRLRSSQPASLADWLLERNPMTDPVRMDAARADPKALAIALDYLSTTTFPEIWNRSQTACLLIHGQNDPAILSPTVEQMMAMPSQVHAIGFEDSGHFPMLEESSKFNRLMVDFLALTSGESPKQLQLKEEWKRRVR